MPTAVKHSLTGLLERSRRAYIMPVPPFLVFHSGIAWRLLILLLLFPSTTLLSQRARRPEYDRREERYWEEMHAKEQQELLVAERREEEHREGAKAALPALLEEGDALQSKFIQIEDGHLIRHAVPSIFERYPDHFRFGALFVLLLGLGAIMSARHREAARLRKLCGDYLCDGMEAAKYQVPEWFSAVEAQVAKQFTLHANPSSKDFGLPAAAIEFFDKAPEHLTKIRALLKETGFSESEQRQQALTNAYDLICELRNKATVWELRPAWQICSALEVLLGRLVKRPNDTTPSVMRTMAGAIDVLHEVCVPGVRPNLLIDPPIKILAVDDLELCRRALKYALEKANLTPDLAESGEKAVEMATAHAYDVVFMDIQMPGIDGLTACTQIHDTKKNADVPVIFVTVQSDFQTRTQVRLKGGTDLIAKPYLVFELTLKAVTFAMNRRLKMADSEAQYYTPESVATPILQLPLPASQEQVPSSIKPSPSHNPAATLFPRFNGEDFSDMPHCLTAMQETLTTLRALNDAETRQPLLERMHLLTQAFVTKARQRELVVTARVANGLDALMKKLHQAPKLVSESILNTIAKALELLNQIGSPEIEQRLADHSAVQILVVEDEPLSRRAVVGALQLAFEKPVSAEDGVAAFELARDKHYDVIFTDVEMPRMDGFELCTRLRAEGVNRDTPVVFITRHADTAARTRASESGGSDFISKPFLPIEIAVKALTFAWESRYRKLAVESAGEEPPGSFNRIEDTAAVLPENPFPRPQANVLQ